MIEQLMMMGCTFVVIKEETLEKRPSMYHRPGWQAGKWKALIRTKLCQSCIEKLQNKTEEAYEEYKNEENVEIEPKKYKESNVVPKINETNESQQLHSETPMDVTVSVATAVKPPTTIYTEPQLSDTVMNVNLPYFYPPMEYLHQICSFHNLTFKSYPFRRYENFLNSEIVGKTNLIRAGIFPSEYSGFEALSFLLTGSIVDSQNIRNLIYNHIENGNLSAAFYR
uniref:Uncharacterized protein n=1 Tax=Panagrolaimus sp. ES5 TaxID=591445 RepID=A0AC34F5Z7_9BILA